MSNWGYSIIFVAVLLFGMDKCMGWVEESEVLEGKDLPGDPILWIFLCFVAIFLINYWMSKKNL